MPWSEEIPGSFSAAPPKFAGDAQRHPWGETSPLLPGIPALAAHHRVTVALCACLMAALQPVRQEYLDVASKAAVVSTPRPGPAIAPASPPPPPPPLPPLSATTVTFPGAKACPPPQASAQQRCHCPPTHLDTTRTLGLCLILRPWEASVVSVLPDGLSSTVFAARIGSPSPAATMLQLCGSVQPWEIKMSLRGVTLIPQRTMLETFWYRSLRTLRTAIALALVLTCTIAIAWTLIRCDDSEVAFN
ncbi:unnamed protein product [Parajaminaea phylloscopi]